MMKEVSLVLMIGLTLVLAGCIQENSTGPNTKEITLENQINAAEYSLGETDIPFIEENDTVEIGELI